MLRKTALSLLLVIAFALAGCSPASMSTPVPATATVPPTPAPQLCPQTHMDALERSVTISAKPARIVSLAPSVTEILFAIGAGPQVVGRTKFSNYPPELGGFSAKSISLDVE